MSDTLTILSRAALLAEPPVPSPAPWLHALPRDPAQPPAWVRLLADGALRRPAAMERWPRLDRYGQALTAAVAAALQEGAATGVSPDAALATGLVAVSENSCLETNAAFDQGFIGKDPRLASPKLFPYTLPGAGASEAAMQFGLTGDYLIFSGGAATALAAFVTATDRLNRGAARRLILVGADLLGPHTWRSFAAMGDLPSPRDPPAAEGAAALWLGRGDDPARGPRLAVTAGMAPAAADLASWRSCIGETLAQAGVGAGDLQTVVSASATRPRQELDEAAMAAISAPHHDGVERPLLLAWRAGNAGAALGVLAVGSILDDAGGSLGAHLLLAGDDALRICLLLAPQPSP